MAKQKRQETNTGSGDGQAPILAGGKPSTEGESTPSQASIEAEPKNTKPVSLSEALSLW